MNVLKEHGDGETKFLFLDPTGETQRSLKQKLEINIWLNYVENVKPSPLSLRTADW